MPAPADLLKHESYAVVLAHPDDEVYSAATIRSLAQAGREVVLLYLTNGDGAGDNAATVRFREMYTAIELLGGVGILPLGFSERNLWDVADEAVERLTGMLTDLQPDCIIGHDWEGGHNGHDLVSFCSYVGARAISADLWAFPAYHGPPADRTWNQFIPGRSPGYVRLLSDDERALKKDIIVTHASQLPFFRRLLLSASGTHFLNREVLRQAETTDFTTPPTIPLGYEAPGSTARYDLLQDVIARHLPQ